jgi:hypothetical protein
MGLFDSLGDLALNIGTGGLYGQMKGAEEGAAAQQGIADAQRQQALQDRAQALQLAAPTAQEIQGISDRLTQQQRYQAVQEAGLARDQKVLGSLDPALITAGQQANSLMQGQEASILAPMKQQQQFERNQLQQQLAAQYGPGFATSSGGQQAMQMFDMNSNLQLQQAQMSAFNQVSQFLGFNLGQRTAMQSQERLGFETGSNMSAQTMGEMGNIQGRQLGAFGATMPGLMNTAGNQYAGQAAQAQADAGIGKSITAMVGTVAGAAMGKPSSSQTMGSQSQSLQSG